MSIPQSKVVDLLQALSFEYTGQVPPQEFELHPSENYEGLEEFLGWEIQWSPRFCVIQVSTGSTWQPICEFTEDDVERLKALILEGIRADLERLVGGMR